MLWGVFVGSYSSIFVAAPIIYEIESRQNAKRSGSSKR
jgi:preprotein translocase subunit SecF